MLFHQKYLVKVFICLASLNHLEFFSFDYLTHNNIILNFSLLLHKKGCKEMHKEREIRIET
jgi:hypothetical protein